MHEGGCLCGELRYRATAEPVDTGYCHCTLCRRSTGAPVLAWATFAAAAFEYTVGSPTIFRSSSWGQREFCGRCGTQVCYRDTRSGQQVDVNIGGLDEAHALPPRSHIYTEEQLPWLSIEDDLPRHAGPGPNSDAP